MDNKTARPLVSVALCSYNGARYLRQQLESVLAQDYGHIEIVAVDDCSTDDTFSILKEYQSRDTRIRAYRNPVNIGFKKNFERAMSLCAGDFIAPCDQDDVWLADKLSILLAAIGDHALVFCDSEIIDERGRSLRLSMSDIFVMVSTQDPVIFATGNCVSGHAMLIRRELVERALPAPDVFFHDWWLAAVAASSGGVKYCAQKLVKYRQHGANVTDVLGARERKTRNRYPGYRWDNLRELRVRLECLAALPGVNRLFIERLRDLWIAREAQWFSPALAYFMFCHGPRLYTLQKLSRRFLMKHSIKYLWGLRLKRLTNHYAYTPTHAEPARAPKIKSAPIVTEHSFEPAQSFVEHSQEL